jgi:hypothetical protein
MTVLTLERLRRHRVPSIALRAVAHRDLSPIKGLEVWHGVERVSLEADPSVAVQADGESLGLVDAAKVAWAPDALRVMAGP